MLRSVVGAAAANMMLVQYGSDAPISLACSPGGAASVQTAASSGPRPGSGTSQVCAQADFNTEISSCMDRLWRSFPAEVSSVQPHPMQDHTDPTRQGHHGPLGAAPFRDPRGPCPQPTTHGPGSS